MYNTYEEALKGFLKAGYSQEEAEGLALKLFPQDKKAMVDVKDDVKLEDDHIIIGGIDVTSEDGLKQYISLLRDTVQNDKKKDGDGKRDTLAQEKIDHLVNQIKNVQQNLIAKKRPVGFDDSDLKYISKRSKSGLRLSNLLQLPTKSEQVKNFQRLNDDVYLAMRLMQAKEKGFTIDNLQSILGLKYDELQAAKDELAKALDTATAAEGSEWIPTGFSMDFTEVFHLEFNLAEAFERLSMPTNPWTLPILTSDATAYKGTEPTADSSTKYKASTPGTSSVTFTAVNMNVRVVWSEDFDEDSVVAVLPSVRNAIVNALNVGLEKAIHSGDTAATHQDTTVTAADDIKKSWLGHRAYALDNSSTMATDINGALAEASLSSVRKKLGNYGAARPRQDLLWYTGYNLYVTLQELEMVQTLDKYGSIATVLTGELGSINGIPLIISDSYPNTTAAGINDGTDGKDSIILVHRPSWKLGDKTMIELESQRMFGYGQIEMIARARMDFKHVRASGQTTVSYGYNITQ